MKLPAILTRHTSPQQARALAARFADGTTTPADERRLYAFFGTHAAGTLDADLEALRPMMMWYASLAAQRHRHSGRRAATAAVAATIGAAAIAGSALLLGHRTDADDTLYARYEGSYVIRGGQRISDVKAIYASLRTAERTADSLGMLTELPDGIYDADDPDVVLVEQALSGIDDPDVVEEIKRDIFSNI